MFRRVLAAAALSAAGLLSGGAAPAPVTPVSPLDLAHIWDTEHVSPPLPPLLDHDEIERRLQAVHQADPSRFLFDQVGASLEGRSINMITTGSGPYRVMLWSQMHGDEPTATAALFDVLDYFERHRADPVVQRIYSSLTLYIVPMLNPDGAERYTRRNAQGIDINRDALRVQSPEGQVLKDLRDRFKPRLGFNLHNENWNTSVGDPPQPASISLLAVAYDTAHARNPASENATKKVCSVIRDALEPFASGQIGRYDEDFEVRAFGDNFTLWGTPVVLIETGPFPAAAPDPALVRMNFVAIISALDALATGNVDKADPARYDSLPRNSNKELYVIVRNATVIAGTGVPPFTADVGINAVRRVKTIDGRRQIVLQTTITDLGDLRTSGALRTIDATGLVAAPIYDPGLKEGQEISLPDWSHQPAARTILPQQPGELMLLRPLDGPPGQNTRYRIETILTF